jgi:pectinesterase
MTVAASHASADPKTLEVAADGTGEFKTVQAAVDAVPTGGADASVIHLRPGTYKGRVTIPKGKRVTLRGDDAATTLITFDLNANMLGDDGKPIGTFRTATVMADADDFVAENVTFENSAGDHGQALALAATGDRQVYRTCRLLGWQDTLYADGGRCYFRDCYLEGRVDFIFGGATVVFDHCTIHSKNGGYVTAARTSPDQRYGFVFLDCTLTGQGAPAYLGRPWQWDRGRKANVVFIRTRMGNHIRKEGWNPWDRPNNANTKPAETSRYYEFGSIDAAGNPLDVSGRVPWSRQLSADEAAEYTVPNVLRGSAAWDPGATASTKPTVK